MRSSLDGFRDGLQRFYQRRADALSRHEYLLIHSRVDVGPKKSLAMTMTLVSPFLKPWPAYLRFFTSIGAGSGNIRSNTFMAALRSSAKGIFGQDYSEAKLCGDTKLAIDFYFPEEETAVEIAGMLGAPNPEYEKAIFKCLAQDAGCKIRKLVFIAKPGATKIHTSPGRGAVTHFVKKRFGIDIVLEELVDPGLA